ncbi:zinc-binding dehydrogenase [Pseudomonas sp. CT11-2]|uniref:zinc-dependent alcohol dehydrogenase n=1 Tax=Pseudomonas sp. CT11-2 TaxID=3243023 RepID=UPI0039B079A0
MRAVVFHDPGHIEMNAQATVPKVAPGEVLIRVEACGICGSDLHMYRANAHRKELVRVDPEGLEIPGHEFSGVITAVGEGVVGYNIGERVVGVGMGGMADLVPVPVNPFQLVHIPDNVSFVAAATTEPLADGLQMIRKADLKPGDNVVVFGVGIIGLGVIQALKALAIDIGKIVAIDVSDERLAVALEVGATDTINPRRQDLLSTAKAICGFLPISYPEIEPTDISVVFECAGYLKHMTGPVPLESALRLVRPADGRVICFGAYEDRLNIDLMPMITKQISLFGSNGYAAGDLSLALQLMSEGEVDRERLISHQFALADVREAFEAQGNGQAIKVMLIPNQVTL